MEKPALRNPEQYPTDDLLKSTLGTTYPAFETLTGFLTEISAEVEWNFYRDGHAWLGKMLYGKKNLGWIAVFDGYFQTSCFFTEKHVPAIALLELSESVKEDFFRRKPAGKLIAMPIEVRHAELPEDIRTMLRFKKSLK